MGRAPCCDKNGLKKGPWTPEEDQKLIDHIQKHGYGNWRTLPKNAGLQRCGKSCRLRWTNYLRPDIKRGRFSFEEEETIIQLHSILGNKWSAIAARLPGRTDNEIKNYWNTHIRKRLLRMGIDPVTHSPRLDLLDLSSIFNSFDLYNNYSFGLQNHHHLVMNTELLKLATSLFSSSASSSHQHQQLQQQNNLPSTTSFHHQLIQNHNHNQLISCPAAAPPVHTPASQQLQAPIIPDTSASTMSLVDSNPLPCFPYPSTHHDQEAHVIGPSFDQYPAVNDSTNQGFGAAQNRATTSTTPLADHQWQSHDDTSGFIQDHFIPDHHVPADLYGFYTSGSDQTNNNVFDPSPDNSTCNYQPSFGGGGAQQNFNFASVLSTPSSSPTPLNSSSNSTYINGCSTTTTTATEDERESYCSSILKFEIPDILDVSDCFM